MESAGGRVVLGLGNPFAVNALSGEAGLGSIEQKKGPTVENLSNFRAQDRFLEMGFRSGNDAILGPFSQIVPRETSPDGRIARRLSMFHVEQSG